MVTAVHSISIHVVGCSTYCTWPDLGIDPILIAAHIAVRFQGIVSREVKPGEVAAVTVGAISSGASCNIVPNYADIQLTMRVSKLSQMCMNGSSPLDTQC